MSWFPSETTAWYEDCASTTPINFPVLWETHKWPGGVLSLFFRAKLSYTFTFIPTNSINAADLRESTISASSLTTQHRLTNLLQLSKPWYLSASFPPLQYLSPGWVFLHIIQLKHSQHLSPGWVFPGRFQLLFFHPQPQVYFNWEKVGTCYTPQNATQDHQPIWKIWESGETYPAHLDSSRRKMGEGGFQYQHSGSTQSLGEGEKSILGPFFMVIIKLSSKKCTI